MERKRVVELDLLRFLAAAAVALHHILPFAVTRLGYLGVELFFLISGYVVLSTAMNKDGYAFTASRVARLYPTFLIAATLTAGALLLAGQDVSLKQYLLNLTMLPGFAGAKSLDVVYWTLAIEVKFYALMFVLIVSRQIHDIERYLLGWLSLCAMSIAFPAVRLLEHVGLNGYGNIFAAGCLLYLIRRDGISPSRLLALAISLVLAIRHAVMLAVAGGVTGTGEYFHIHVAAIVVAEYAIFLALAMGKWHLPQWRGWSTLGALTYPLYLVHNEASLALSSLVGGYRVVTIAIGAALAIGLTFTSERYFCPWMQRTLLSARPRWLGLEKRTVAPPGGIAALSNHNQRST